MKVELLAHTQLSEVFNSQLFFEGIENNWEDVTDGQAVALTAIRTCYSHNEPSEIIELEGNKYFGQKATDGGSGSDASRLIRHIMKSKHVSTMEHINFTFTVGMVSRALLPQETRHRHKSFSVQSQRYVLQESNSKHGKFKYITPPTILENVEALVIFVETMEFIQKQYDRLIALKIPKEDARFVFPNAAATNMVVSFNLRTFLEYYKKRQESEGAQWEIAQLAEKFKEKIIEAEPWTDEFFEQDGD